MITCRRSRSLTWAVSVSLVVPLLAGVLGPHLAEPAAAKRASPRELQVFSNTTPINSTEDPIAVVSTIAVSGFETEVADVDVTLHDINHGKVGDLDILLVGPGGQSAVIFSDVGSSASNVTLRLDDGAANQIPSSGPLASGAFQPTNFQFVDAWRPPAPLSPPSGSELGIFNSTDPNGVWTLFLVEDASGVDGTLSGGWSLRITSANGVPNAAPDSFSVKAGKTLSVVASGVLANDDDPDGNVLQAILAGAAKKGNVELLPNGAFTYRSSKKAKGKDSFTYLAKDASGLSDLETVTIQVKKAKKKDKGKK